MTYITKKYDEAFINKNSVRTNYKKLMNWFKNQEPRIQNGRWNHSFSNTKMFPIISRGFEYGSLNETSKNNI